MKGRVRHLPDSCLLTSLEQKVLDETLLIPSPPLPIEIHPTMCTNTNVKKCNAIYIGETHQMLSKCVNWHHSNCTVMNSDLLLPIHILSHQCWSIRVIHKLPDATPPISAANVKRHVNSFLNPANSQVSTFDSLTRPPSPLLPIFPLAAPANTRVILLLQLMKATVLAESTSYFIFSAGYLH